MQGAQKTLEARRRLLESGGATTTSRQQQREIQAELERALATAQHKVQQLLQERSKLVQAGVLMQLIYSDINSYSFRYPATATLIVITSSTAAAAVAVQRRTTCSKIPYSRMHSDAVIAMTPSGACGLKYAQVKKNLKK